MRYSLMLALIVVVVIYSFMTGLLEAYGDDYSWLRDQLHYYLRNIFGLDIPRNFSMEILSIHNHSVWIGVWESCSYYKIKLLYDDISFNVGVCLGNNRKIVGLTLDTSSTNLNKLNWTKEYTISGIVYDPDECLVNITNRPKVLATLLSIIKNVSKVNIVNEYLSIFTDKLCTENCLKEIGDLSIVNEVFHVCPGLMEGTGVTLSSGHELDYGFSARDNSFNINIELKINLTRHLSRYEVLELTLTRLKGDQYVLTSFYWKPYHTVPITPDTQLTQRLEATAISYIRRILADVVPESINKSTCRLDVVYTRIYPFYREIYLNNTSLLIEYPIIYGVRIKCKYNSTAYWVRVIDVLISPYSSQVLKTYTGLPRIDILKVKGVNQWINVILAIISLTILVSVMAIIRLRKHK